MTFGASVSTGTVSSAGSLPLPSPPGRFLRRDSRRCGFRRHSLSGLGHLRCSSERRPRGSCRMHLYEKTPPIPAQWQRPQSGRLSLYIVSFVSSNGEFLSVTNISPSASPETPWAFATVPASVMGLFPPAPMHGSSPLFCLGNPAVPRKARAAWATADTRQNRGYGNGGDHAAAADDADVVALPQPGKHAVSRQYIPSTAGIQIKCPPPPVRRRRKSLPNPAGGVTSASGVPVGTLTVSVCETVRDGSGSTNSVFVAAAADDIPDVAVPTPGRTTRSWAGQNCRTPRKYPRAFHAP